MAHAKRKPPSTPPLLTVAEAAECMGVTTSTINRWATEEKDPLPSRFVALKRRVVFPKDLREWAKRHGLEPLVDPAEVAQPWPRRGNAA